LILFACGWLGACSVFGDAPGKQSSSSTSPPSPTAPTGSSVTPTRADLDFCVSETNRYRASVGAPALGSSSAVEQFAAAAAQADHIANSPHSYYRAQGQGGAENEILRAGAVFAGTTAHSAIAFAIAGFWSEGPGGGHYENMAAPYGVVGCGAYNEGQLWTVVQEFR
jgi:uncharacterized protein YkwD